MSGNKKKYYVYKTSNGMACVSGVEKKELEDDLIGISSTVKEAQRILVEYIIKPIRKYRIGYDYVFLPKNSFEYKGDLIGSMSVIVLFKIFDIEGNEILFKTKGEELKEQTLMLKSGEKCFLCNLLKCYFDKDKFKESNSFDFIQAVCEIKSGYRVSFEINSYTKDIDNGILEPIQIDENEFNDIILNNLELFNVTDNKPAQSTSYITEEV
ncbi:hypothetical protein K5V21_12695 [Clostridium sardiniense]|uniref:Uncharacterized protein n=1 Tax=Clostridium sardiniense TaxID=29369 RepID=A0ABS7KZS3_CLOSR|nr:hypothetical protein [Clostridium sardiniense]MBY0756306.1 hypothetical protein [Clostridium sardiniense]MDQ0461461.1 Ni,Fe-hydrogenase maturation factor [Clostridium sardiniense]